MVWEISAALTVESSTMSVCCLMWGSTSQFIFFWKKKTKTSAESGNTLTRAMRMNQKSKVVACKTKTMGGKMLII